MLSPHPPTPGSCYTVELNWIEGEGREKGQREGGGEGGGGKGEGRERDGGEGRERMKVVYTKLAQGRSATILQKALLRTSHIHVMEHFFVLFISIPMAHKNVHLVKHLRLNLQDRHNTITTVLQDTMHG